jgi:hypothetical protein
LLYFVFIVVCLIFLLLVVVVVVVVVVVGIVVGSGLHPPSSIARHRCRCCCCPPPHFCQFTCSSHHSLLSLSFCWLLCCRCCRCCYGILSIHQIWISSWLTHHSSFTESNYFIENRLTDYPQRR